MLSLIVRIAILATINFAVAATSASAGNEEAILNAVRPFLKADSGARVYYEAVCPHNPEELAPPALDIASSAKTNGGVAAIREIFKNDPTVTVTKDETGMVRITLGAFSAPILKTTITALTLNQYEQYSAHGAIVRIQTLPEITAAQRRLGHLLSN